jgi:agmatinase
LEVRDALVGVAKRGKVVGIDLVEVSPVFDCSEMTSNLAVDLLLHFLAAAFPSKE